MTFHTAKSIIGNDSQIPFRENGNREEPDVSQRSNYKTKQKEILINYFKSSPGVHITAGDVCEHCKSVGENIGQSTVYRQLEKLVDEGIINKYIIDPGSPACFEYVGEDSHQDSDVCFHCKCEKCGKLIHMHCEELEEMGLHIMKEHGFKVDAVRTIIYGLCEECSRE